MYNSNIPSDGLINRQNQHSLASSAQQSAASRSNMPVNHDAGYRNIASVNASADVNRVHRHEPIKGSERLISFPSTVRSVIETGAGAAENSAASRTSDSVASSSKTMPYRVNVDKAPEELAQMDPFKALVNEPRSIVNQQAFFDALVLRDLPVCFRSLPLNLETENIVNMLGLIYRDISSADRSHINKIYRIFKKAGTDISKAMDARSSIFFLLNKYGSEGIERLIDECFTCNRKIWRYYHPEYTGHDYPGDNQMFDMQLLRNTLSIAMSCVPHIIGKAYVNAPINSLITSSEYVANRIKLCEEYRTGHDWFGVWWQARMLRYCLSSLPGCLDMQSEIAVPREAINEKFSELFSTLPKATRTATATATATRTPSTSPSLLQRLADLFLCININ